MKKQLTANQLLTIIAKKVGVSDATVSNWVAKLPKSTTTRISYMATPRIPQHRSLLSRLFNRK